MCLICIEYQKGKLKINEAFSNLEEMRVGLDKNHAQYVEDMLVDDMWENLGTFSCETHNSD